MVRSAVVGLLLMAPGVAHAQHADWELGVMATAASISPLAGAGVGATGLYGIGDHFAVGVVADFARLSMSGDRADNGRPYRAGVYSLFMGAAAQLRAHLGPVMPYGELLVGATVADVLYRENVQCSYHSGLGLGLAAGAKVPLGPMAVGLRGAARLPAGSMSCDTAFGPAGLGWGGLLQLGATVGVRW